MEFRTTSYQPTPYTVNGQQILLRPSEANIDYEHGEAIALGAETAPAAASKHTVDSIFFEDQNANATITIDPSPIIFKLLKRSK